MRKKANKGSRDQGTKGATAVPAVEPKTQMTLMLLPELADYLADKEALTGATASRTIQAALYHWKEWTTEDAKIRAFEFVHQAERDRRAARKERP